MKNMKIIAITLAAIVVLSSCGREVEKGPATDFSSTTAAVTVIDAENLRDNAAVEVETESVSVDQATTETWSLPDQIIPEITTVAEASPITDTNTSNKSSKGGTTKEKVVYKPSTHYIHKASCYWVDDTCYEIKNTKGIECRKCTECNPDIKIVKKYKEKKKKQEIASGDNMIIEYENDWPVDQRLNPYNGTVEGPSGKETYYNLDMTGVISIMRDMGFDEENYPYWIRDDKAKMLGNYVMCAANLEIYPRGTLVESTLGMCLVCDTGGFAYSNPYQIDLACDW